MHELVVATDLLRRGYDVFRSLSPASTCDLAILKNRRLIRVEVTTAASRNDHQVTIPKARERARGVKFDLLAIVIRNGDNSSAIHYRPERF